MILTSQCGRDKSEAATNKTAPEYKNLKTIRNTRLDFPEKQPEAPGMVTTLLVTEKICSVVQAYLTKTHAHQTVITQMTNPITTAQS